MARVCLTSNPMQFIRFASFEAVSIGLDSFICIKRYRRELNPRPSASKSSSLTFKINLRYDIRFSRFCLSRQRESDGQSDSILPRASAPAREMPKSVMGFDGVRCESGSIQLGCCNGIRAGSFDRVGQCIEFGRGDGRLDCLLAVVSSDAIRNFARLVHPARQGSLRSPIPILGRVY